MRLELRINDLCDNLRSSGKTGPAEYYEGLFKRIKEPLNETDKVDALQQIISSGKLSDIANFSFEEDKLFDQVYDEAKKLKVEY
jgi:hypothetical protein